MAYSNQKQALRVAQQYARAATGVATDQLWAALRQWMEKEMKAYGDAAQSDEEIGVGEVGWDGRTRDESGCGA